MNNKYANYDYQSTTTPFKNDIGVTIGKETTSKFKLCTKDCKYKSNWKALKEWLDEQLMYFKENNEQSGFSDNVEDLEMVLDKMNSLEGDK